jgi:hypothetical protein
MLVPAVRLKSPPRRRPDAYERLHARIWRRLELEGDVFPACDGTRRIAGFCPVCGTGTISFQLIATDPPRVRISECSDGCHEDWIAGTLR